MFYSVLSNIFTVRNLLAQEAKLVHNPMFKICETEESIN